MLRQCEQTLMEACAFDRLTVEEDTKIPNAATVTINKEDHTLAGMLRS